MDKKLKKVDKKYDSNHIINKWRTDKKILKFYLKNNLIVKGIIIDFSNYDIVILHIKDDKEINYSEMSPIILYKHSITMICSDNTMKYFMFNDKW